LARNQTYRAFVARPTHILNLDGEILDSTPVMAQLVSEIQGISAYATYVTRNDTRLEAGLAQAGTVQPAVAGRRAGVTMPDFLASGRTGKSRKEWLVRGITSSQLSAHGRNALTL